MMRMLEQLGWASLAGGGVIVLAWAIARVFRLGAAARSTVWRLAIAKLLVLFAVSAALDLPLLAPPSWDEVVEKRDARWAAAEKASEADEPAPAPAPPPVPGWALGLSALWAAGVLAGAATLVRGWRHARRLRGAALPVTSGAAFDILIDVSRQMGLSKAPALALVADGPGPMLSGLRRPTVLLPAALADRPEPELRMMLAHEVAHRVRHDLAWNLVFTAARALFFFHPLVHLVAREAALDQEAAADELALATTGAPAKSYGEMLLGLLRDDTTPLAALHAGSSATALRRRLADLSRARRQMPARSRAGVAIGAVVALLVLMPWKVVQRDADVTLMPVSMAIKDVNLEVVAMTISINSGFIVAVPPEISKRTVSVNFRDVPAIEALRQIAASADLRLVPVPYVTTAPAYMLLPPGHPDPVKVFKTDAPGQASMALRDASAIRVLETVAVNMNWNVVIDPGVKEKAISVNLADWRPSQAMNYIADMAQYQLEEHPSPGAQPTWVIKPRR